MDGREGVGKVMAGGEEAMLSCGGHDVLVQSAPCTQQLSLPVKCLGMELGSSGYCLFTVMCTASPPHRKIFPLHALFDNARSRPAHVRRMLGEGKTLPPRPLSASGAITLSA